MTEALIGEIRKATEIGYTRGKYIWHACVDCGKERWVQMGKGLPKTSRCCSCSSKKKIHPSGPAHHGWNGGKTTDSEGYIHIKIYPDDFFYPMIVKRNGYVLEHRLVMARHLGRCLLPWEVVHHKNSIRDDNRLENLELLPTGKHHLPSIRMAQVLRKQTKAIKDLQDRVTILEMENVLLREQMKSPEGVYGN